LQDPERCSASAVSVAVDVAPKPIRAANVRNEPGIESSNVWNGLTIRQTTRYVRSSHYG
jgi:hypothetical protein